MSSTSATTIAFFDVDHTLIQGNSGFITTMDLLKRKLYKKRRLFQAVYFTLASKIFFSDIRKVYHAAIADLIGLKAEPLYVIGDEVFQNKVKPRLYTEGLDAIRKHQDKGHRVVLLSSGPEMTLKSLQRFVKADMGFMMAPRVRDGLVTGELNEPLCNAQGKIHYAKIACQQLGAKLKDCFFYSDHYTDVPMLKAVGFPRVVNPDWRLKKIARKNHWTTLHFNHPLGYSGATQ